MDLRSRMRASMLIVIMFCMMCVTSVLGREEQKQADTYAACEVR